MKISISEAEYMDHCDSYDGVCLACGEWTSGGCEPDAVMYRCEICGKKKVYGAEEALMMGAIHLTEDDE